MFHGYQTPVGTTYNAYLVQDGQQITLVDSVKHDFADAFLGDIRAIIGERLIDNLICNHAEPDHSGALPALAKAYPGAAIYGTANCGKIIRAYYPDIAADRYHTVKKGDTLPTGGSTFHFYPMPMVHWPDSMATYLAEERILFSNDAFGQHIGTGELFDEELPWETLASRAGDYYANIILPYGGQVGRAWETLGGLDIEMVCPSHGVILRRDFARIADKYGQWRQNQTDAAKAVIIYDTMWGTTRKLACRLRDEYEQKGISAEIIDLSQKHASYAMAQLLEARHICVGSPTLNNNMMPTVSAFLTCMGGLKPKNRAGRAFGAYGWSGESIGQIHEALAGYGFELEPPLKAMWNI